MSMPLLMARARLNHIIATPFDPYWSYVISLLHFDGSDGSTTFTDQITANSWSNNSTAAELSTAEAKFGPSSLKLNGSNAGISNGASATWENFNITGDYTIDSFVYPLSNSGTQVIMDMRSPAYAENCWQFILNSGKLTFHVWSSGGLTLVINMAGATTLTTNTWHMASMSRIGTTWMLFLDGNLDATATQTGTPGTLNIAPYIGLNGAANNLGWNGYLDEIRLTNGVGRYSASFTPPTAPFPNH